MSRLLHPPLLPRAFPDWGDYYWEYQWRLAQDYLIRQLERFARPLPHGAEATTGPDAYRHAFAGGTNLLAVIPGGDLARQYVIVGAHYDHLGSGPDCGRKTATDRICNGATGSRNPP